MLRNLRPSLYYWLVLLYLWGGGMGKGGIVISLPFIACFDKIYLSYTPSPLLLSLNSLSFPPPSFRNELTRKSAKFEFLLNGPRPRHQRLENKRHFSHTHAHPHTGSWHHRELWGFVIDAVNKNRETIVAVSVLEVLYSAFKKWRHTIQMTNEMAITQTKLPMADQYTFSLTIGWKVWRHFF